MVVVVVLVATCCYGRGCQCPTCRPIPSNANTPRSEVNTSISIHGEPKPCFNLLQRQRGLPLPLVRAAFSPSQSESQSETPRNSRGFRGGGSSSKSWDELAERLPKGSSAKSGKWLDIAWRYVDFGPCSSIFFDLLPPSWRFKTRLVYQYRRFRQGFHFSWVFTWCYFRFVLVLWRAGNGSVSDRCCEPTEFAQNDSAHFLLRASHCLAGQCGTVVVGFEWPIGSSLRIDWLPCAWTAKKHQQKLCTPGLSSLKQPWKTTSWGTIVACDAQLWRLLHWPAIWGLKSGMGKSRKKLDETKPVAGRMVVPLSLD